MHGTMALFKGPHKPFELRQFPLPVVEDNDVLVKVSMAMICGSDLHFWRGDIPVAAVAKTGAGILGHEMVGRVHTLGKNVKTDSRGAPVKEGDRVAYTYFAGCMACQQCARGAIASCASKKMFITSEPGAPPYFTGGFGEYFYVGRGHYFYKVPDDLPDNWVAPVNCSFSQVYFGLHLANLEVGESCVIQGAGGLGLYATAAAKERGASPLIVIDGIENRLKLAREFGADEVVDMRRYKTPEERVARVKELVGALGADVVMEVVGFPAAFVEGVQMVRLGGRYAMLGQVSRADAGTVLFTPATLLGRTIVSAGCYDPWVLPKVLDFMSRNKNKYPFHKMVSHQYPLAQITQAFQDSEWARPGAEGLAVTRTAIVT